MEKQLKCVLLLSLKEMALRRVAVLLWSGSDISASISKFRSYGYFYEEVRKDWIETIEGKVEDKILKLELPKSLTKQMIDIVRPIGLQIKRRKEFKKDIWDDVYQEISLPNSSKLCWTTAGTIDYRKTAEELVLCNELDIRQRYDIACVYCLEDYIPLLWEELPEETKEFLYNRKVTTSDLTLGLSFCWPHILKGEFTKRDYLWRTSDRNLTVNQWAFEYSAENYYKTATEYFFHKLTHEERGTSLMRTVEAVVEDQFRGPESTYLFLIRNEILCFLLSVMIPEQRMEIVKARPIDVFSCFLVWPLQDLLLENTGLIWTFLPPSGYGDLLQKMANGFRSSDHYFPKLFQEFFIQSPVDFKKYIVGDSDFGDTPAYHLLDLLFRSEDSESIEVIFRNVDAADRMKLVFKGDVLGLFYDFVFMDKSHLVVVCLQEAALSKEDMEGSFNEMSY